MNNTTIGLDLAKNVFHAVCLSEHGNDRWRKKLSRGQLARFFAKQEHSIIAMEACASAHYWARLFVEMGHEVKLLPPQHVKAYARGQKNDFNDALAIAEACRHGRIRSVPIKTIVQQDEQVFHRLRRQRINERTRLANQMRGLLGEYGLTIGKGIHQVRAAVPAILEDGENGLTVRGRELISRQYNKLLEVWAEIDWFDEQVKQQSKQDDVCRRLQEVPGFGPVVSSALKCWIGDATQFHCGREASAALGVVPRQHSSGGKSLHLGISKRGDSYVRSLLIHGARSVAMHAHKKQDALSRWVVKLIERRGMNKATVALANKLIRIAWVIVARGERYTVRSVAEI